MLISSHLNPPTRDKNEIFSQLFQRPVKLPLQQQRNLLPLLLLRQLSSPSLLPPRARFIHPLFLDNSITFEHQLRSNTHFPSLNNHQPHTDDLVTDFHTIPSLTTTKMDRRCRHRFLRCPHYHRGAGRLDPEIEDIEQTNVGERGKHDPIGRVELPSGAAKNGEKVGGAKFIHRQEVVEVTDTGREHVIELTGWDLIVNGTDNQIPRVLAGI